MYPSSTPLVPDDQFHDHDFAPRDLDSDRELNEQRRRRPQRQNPIRQNTFPLDVEDALGELVLGPVDGREVGEGAVAEAGEDLVAVAGRVDPGGEHDQAPVGCQSNDTIGEPFFRGGSDRYRAYARLAVLSGAGQ